MTDSHIAEIERAVQTMLYPDELYERFLFHLTAAMAAHGAAIWRLEATDKISLSASTGPSDEQDREAWDEHRDFIVASIGPGFTGQQIYPPGVQGNPTALVLLLQKIHARCPLVIEVAQRADAPPPSLRGYSTFLEQMADQLAQAKCIPWE